MLQTLYYTSNKHIINILWNSVTELHVWVSVLHHHMGGAWYSIHSRCVRQWISLMNHKSPFFFNLIYIRKLCKMDQHIYTTYSVCLPNSCIHSLDHNCSSWVIRHASTHVHITVSIRRRSYMKKYNRLWNYDMKRL